MKYNMGYIVLMSHNVDFTILITNEYFTKIGEYIPKLFINLLPIIY